MPKIYENVINRKVRLVTVIRQEGEVKRETMKIIGSRKEPKISFASSPLMLSEGARFNDEIHKIPTGKKTFFPKGVYRYKTHQEANKHWTDFLVIGVSETVLDKTI